MKKLLFLTTQLPFPSANGGKVKSLKLINALSEQYQITLACPLKQCDAEHVDAFHVVSPCVRHLHAPVDVPISVNSLRASYSKRWPLDVHCSFHPLLSAQVRCIAHHFDVIFLDHYEVFPYVPPTFKGFVVFYADRAHHENWARQASLQGNPALHIGAWLESRRVRRYERNVARRANLVFSTPNDARALLTAGVDPGRIRVTHHLGDDSYLELDELRFENTGLKLMYDGHLHSEPNIQGLLWFIESVWPRIKSRQPKLVFDIVGEERDQRLKDAVAAHPDIRLRGIVENLQSVYRESRVSVAPLLFDTGAELKVLDAMARGMPTVTTSVGAEGIAAESGRHLLIADDANTMAWQILALLTNQGLWERLRSNSRSLVQEQYSWRPLFDVMHREIRVALGQHREQSLPNLVAQIQHAN